MYQLDSAKDDDTYYSSAFQARYSMFEQFYTVLAREARRRRRMSRGARKPAALGEKRTRATRAGDSLGVAPHFRAFTEVRAFGRATFQKKITKRLYCAVCNGKNSHLCRPGEASRRSSRVATRPTCTRHAYAARYSCDTTILCESGRGQCSRSRGRP